MYVCVCVHVCMCVCVYTHSHTHTHIHIYLCLKAGTSMKIHEYAHMANMQCMCTSTDMHKCIDFVTRGQIIALYICLHAFLTYIYIYIYIYIYADVLIPTYIPTRLFLCQPVHVRLCTQMRIGLDAKIAFMHALTVPLHTGLRCISVGGRCVQLRGGEWKFQNCSMQVFICISIVRANVCAICGMPAIVCAICGMPAIVCAICGMPAIVCAICGMPAC
jgi:hypothetical protein